MQSFDFISGDDFRESLIKDYDELSRCCEAKAWKAVYVLSGSIIETLLIDYLLSIDYQKKVSVDPLKMDFGKAIEACRKENLLSEKTEQLSMALKSYRNFGAVVECVFYKPAFWD